MVDPLEPEKLVTVFRLSMTESEFTLLLEIVKGTVLATVGALIAFYFNLLATRREQDGTFFNIFVRKRVDIVHSLSNSVALLINDYISILDTEKFKLPQKSIFEGEIEFINRQLQEKNIRKRAIDEFIKGLPDRISQIVAQSESERYTIGEINHLEMCNKLEEFRITINDIWEHYTTVAEPRSRRSSLVFGLGKRKDIDIWRSMIACFDTQVLVSERLALQDLRVFNNNFEAVTRFKGSGKQLVGLRSQFGRLIRRNKREGVTTPAVRILMNANANYLENEFKKWRAEKVRIG